MIRSVLDFFHLSSAPPIAPAAPFLGAAIPRLEPSPASLDPRRASSGPAPILIRSIPLVSPAPPIESAIEALTRASYSLQRAQPLPSLADAVRRPASAGGAAAPEAATEQPTNLRMYHQLPPVERQELRRGIYASLFAHAPQRPTEIPFLTNYNGSSCFIYKSGTNLNFALTERICNPTILSIDRDGSCSCLQWNHTNGKNQFCIKINNEQEISLQDTENFRLDQSSGFWRLSWNRQIPGDGYTSTSALPYFEAPFAAMQLLLNNGPMIANYLQYSHSVFDSILGGFLETFSPLLQVSHFAALEESGRALPRQAAPGLGGSLPMRALAAPPSSSERGVVDRTRAAFSAATGAVAAPSTTPPETERSVILGPVWNPVQESTDSAFTLTLTQRSDGSLTISSSKVFSGRGFGHTGSRVLKITLQPNGEIRLNIKKEDTSRMSGSHGSETEYLLRRTPDGFSILPGQTTTYSHDLGCDRTTPSSSLENLQQDVAYVLNSFRTLSGLWRSPHSLIVCGETSYRLADFSPVPTAALTGITSFSQGRTLGGGISFPMQHSPLY